MCPARRVRRVWLGMGVVRCDLLALEGKARVVGVEEGGQWEVDMCGWRCGVEGVRLRRMGSMGAGGSAATWEVTLDAFLLVKPGQIFGGDMVTEGKMLVRFAWVILSTLRWGRES